MLKKIAGAILALALAYASFHVCTRDTRQAVQVGPAAATINYTVYYANAEAVAATQRGW